MKTSALLIKTPEGIVFSQVLAGPVTRFLAWSIDFLAIAAVISATGILVSALELISRNIATTAFTLSYFVITFGYSILLEWMWRGQTVGKKLLHLRVVDGEGMHLQFNQIMTRNLLRFVDMLPGLYFIGGLTCALNRKCQRLGDIAANTIVVRIPNIYQPDLNQLRGGKFNSLLKYPHLAARLRQKISAAEFATVLQAIIRRNDFEPGARVELFGLLAEHFRSKVDFPAEAMEGLSDEQYLRNVIDVVAGSSPRDQRRNAG